MSPRAAPMSAECRRDALVTATLELVREHGRAVTTRQIAGAAGVAEGTIFRVFDSKEQLVDTAIARAFDPGEMGRQVDAIDPTLPLRERLVELTARLQDRFVGTFTLIRKVGLVGPPADVEHARMHVEWRRALDARMQDVVGPDADQLRVPVADFVHHLRLLTFAGSHAQIADGRLLTPDEIVDTVLTGLLHRPPPPPDDRTA